MFETLFNKVTGLSDHNQTTASEQLLPNEKDSKFKKPFFSNAFLQLCFFTLYRLLNYFTPSVITESVGISSFAISSLH